MSRQQTADRIDSSSVDMRPAGQQLSSPDHVVAEILRGLYAGRYVPGQRLIEADLTREYKVSRGSIREALKRLAAEGVVSLNLHRGAYVRSLSRAEALEVLALIEVLTGLAARLAAERMGHADHRAAIQKVLDEVRAAAGSGDFLQFVRARNRFYRVLVQVGGNRELSRVLPRMHVHLVRVQFRPYGKVAAGQALEDYDRIAEAVLAGDPDLAEAATRRHIHNTSDRIQRLPDEEFAVEE
jgi:DNA-binding GntR family transcriptional regulator